MVVNFDKQAQRLCFHGGVHGESLLHPRLPTPRGSVVHRTTAPSVPFPSQAGLLIAMGIFTLRSLRWPSLSQKLMTALLYYTVAPFESHAASDGVRTTALRTAPGPWSPHPT